MFFSFMQFLGNEWKTRFENQEEINRLLNKQLELTDMKITELKEKLKTNCKIAFKEVFRETKYLWFENLDFSLITLQLSIIE